MTENGAAWHWQIYDIVERTVVGGALGWLATIPLMVVGGFISPELGPNGAAGDYAWFGTIPLGTFLWLWLRRGRPGGWVSRALFGAALGVAAGTVPVVVLGVTGEDIFRVYFISIPAGTILWPVAMRFVLRRKA